MTENPQNETKPAQKRASIITFGDGHYQFYINNPKKNSKDLKFPSNEIDTRNIVLRNVPSLNTGNESEKIRDYLYRRILAMKNGYERSKRQHKSMNMSRKIIFNTLYKELGVSDPNRDKKSDIKSKVDRCLSHWAKQEFIVSYKYTKKPGSNQYDGVEINFIKYKRNDITDMSLMFYGCYSLTNLDISKLNTENVKDMDLMFGNCKSLKNLNISNFNTEKVEKMNLLFQRCSSLEKLNLSNFNTNNVTNMIGMFSFCSSLKKLDLSNFKTNNVTNMIGLFENCYSLTKLNLSNFKTGKVTNMSYMFSFCTSLKFLDISNFSSSKETNMKYMFNHCESLVNLVIRDKFNIYKENSIGMFSNCSEELKDKIQNDKNISGNVFDESLGEFSFDHYRGELFNDKGKSEYIPFFLRFNSCYGAFNTYELINWKDPTKVKIL